MQRRFIPRWLIRRGHGSTHGRLQNGQRTGPPGELVWADNLPGGLDPHVVFDVPMQFYMLNIYDQLYQYEGNPPQLKPWLASGHTVSADGRTWTFSLRDAKFHDGSPDRRCRTSRSTAAPA